MITASELKRMTRETIQNKMQGIKYSILCPLESDIEEAAIECAQANQPYVRRKFILNDFLPSILYKHFTQDYLPKMLQDAGFEVENIELEMRDGGYRILTLEFNWF